MDLGIFAYTATVLIFTGLAFSLYLYRVVFSGTKPLLQKEWKIVAYTMMVGIIWTGPGEYFALLWKTWTYNPERTLYMTFLGAEVETYLFSLLVSLVISVATISSARRIDKENS